MKRVWNATTSLLRNMDDRHTGRMLLLLTGIFLVSFLLLVRWECAATERAAAYRNDYRPAQLPPHARKIYSLVEGYPIAALAPRITRKDPVIAAYLVSIAKKESNWGQRAPKLNGSDCYNYWGFRGNGDDLVAGGHTCFSSPREAVNTVADRITRLVYEEHREHPREMVVWKCGYSCAWDNPASVEKWIADVNYYYNKILN